MEMTEDLVARIAGTIADLRLRVNLLQQMATGRGEKFDEFERKVVEIRGTSVYQQTYDDVLGTLKGGH